jgi:Ig-like domain from next to BRCA1 gene
MSRTRSPSRPRPASTAKVKRYGPSAATATIAAAAIGAIATITAAAFGAFAQTGATRQPAPAPHTARLTSPVTPRVTPSSTATGPLIPGDASIFITDVTYPDGSTVAEGQHFIKTWKIKDIGSVLWTGRYLAPYGAPTGSCAYPPRVSIPVTRPGQDATISVPVTASDSPGLCFVTWKMETGTGILYFPHEIGIWFSITVTSGSS